MRVPEEPFFTRPLGPAFVRVFSRIQSSDIALGHPPYIGTSPVMLIKACSDGDRRFTDVWESEFPVWERGPDARNLAR